MILNNVKNHNIRKSDVLFPINGWLWYNVRLPDVERLGFKSRWAFFRVINPPMTWVVTRSFFFSASLLLANYESEADYCRCVFGQAFGLRWGMKFIIVNDHITMTVSRELLEANSSTEGQVLMLLQ